MKVVLVDVKLLLILTTLSLMILLFDSLGFLTLPKALAQNLTIPIQYGLYHSTKTFTKQFDFILTARKAALENKALKFQLGQLLTENSALRKQLQETESLVDTYGKLNPQTYDLLPARIIGFGRYLTVDKGSDDGVTLGQAVVFKDSFVGQVKSVNPKTAQVLLAADPDSKLAVFSQNPIGRARGILEGQFGSELKMDKILHEEQIEAGDLVYAEGTEGKLARGLIMGKVAEVLARENEVFKQAKVEPIFKVDELDLVFVIKSS